MLRLKWLMALLAAGAGICLVYLGVMYFLPAAPLNVLLITLDTTRADRFGCYGYQSALTPTLDRLAREGILFEKASTPAPLTLPAHASLLTGTYPPEHGLHYNGQNSLGREIPLLPEILNQRGYQTGAFIGAMVLRAKFGIARGFQVYDDNIQGAEPDSGHHDRMRPGETVVDSALSWLQRQKSKPFFCWVHLYDPHHPYQPHEDRFGTKFLKRPYDGEIAYVDQQIERLINDLKSRGLAERTMVIVVGDHGESLGEHGESTHAYMLYEATMHVPLVMKAPHLISPDTRVKGRVSLVDVYPTILDSLQIPLPRPTLGRSLRPAFRGQNLSPGAVYGESDQPFGEFHFASLKSLTTERWKYVRTPKKELYDLTADPAELHNLAAEHPDEVQELDGQLTELEQKMSQGEAPTTHLTAREKRALESLGYAGGNTRPPQADQNLKLPDIKDMIQWVTLYNDALSLMEKEDYSRAEAILRSVTVAVPDMFIAHHNLGICLAAQEQNEKAILSYRRALELRDDGKTRIELGKMYILTSQWAAAIPHLQTAVKQLPDSPRPAFYWGEALRGQGKPREARQQYLRALRMNPRFTPALQALRYLDATTP